MSDAKSFESRVLEELRGGLEFYRIAFLGVTEFSADNLPQIRAHLHPLFEAALAAAPAYPDVEISEHVAPASDRGPALKLRVYRPKATKDQLSPCIYWIHGGGMVMCEARYDDADCCAYAEQVGAVVVSVDYRLAPEHPYPAGVDDCYAGLCWLANNAASLRVDALRIAVAGRSGGGVLAAATVLMARDRRGPAVHFQLLVYPMLDDRNNSASAIEFEDAVSWGARLNRSAWRAVLGDRAGAHGVPYYAAPARAENLEGLPPAFMQVGELEVFRDECIAYAQALLKAGVPCELHVHSGVYHGSDIFNPSASSSTRMAAERYSALRRAFE